MMNIKDKIQKLLALATSPNEHEAREALLKARQLMVKYKVEERVLEKKTDNNVVEELVDATCTTMTNSWAMKLSVLIAEHYCCVSFIERKSRRKTRQFGFIGLENDFTVCKHIFLYAYNYVLKKCDAIRRENSLRSGMEIRSLCNAYGYGFINGLEDTFKMQDAQHREYALVLTTPNEVMKRANRLGNTNYSSGNNRSDVFGSSMYAAQGYADGKTFDPVTKLKG